MFLVQTETGPPGPAIFQIVLHPTPLAQYVPRLMAAGLTSSVISYTFIYTDLNISEFECYNAHMDSKGYSQDGRRGCACDSSGLKTGLHSERL